MRSSDGQQPLDYESRQRGTLTAAASRLRSAFQAAPGHVRFGFTKTMKKWKLGRRGAALLLILILGALLFGVAAMIRWRTQRAWEQSGEQIAGEQDIAFTLQPLDPIASSHFEAVSAPAVFSDAIQFRDHLFLCGAAGLFEYDGSGKLLKSYHPGQELPPAPLQHLATTTESGRPELLIATRGEGLLVFDGHVFRQLLPRDPALRNITAVLPVSTGRILLGTEKHGLLVFDGSSLRLFHPVFETLHITALAGDESDLWVGTLGRGAFHFHSGQAEHFSEAEGLPDAQVLAIAQQRSATYVATPLGVAEFTDGKFARRLGEGVFAQALGIEGDKLLIGTLDEGIWEVPLRTGSRGPRAVNQRLVGAIQRIVSFDAQQNPGKPELYAVVQDGLYRIRGSAFARVLGRDDALLTDRNISALAVDDAGRLLVGYFDRGLDIVEADLRRVHHLEDEHIFCVNRVVFDAQRNSTLVATANGLAILDAGGNLRRVLTRADGLIADHVTDVALTPSGMVLATPAGLTYMDAGGTRSLYAFHGLVNNHVYALGVSHNEVIAGTLGGISALDSDVVRASYTTANSGLKHNWITAVAPVDDEWFVGTYGAGVQRIDRLGQIQTFPDAGGHFVVNPNAMLVTRDHVFAGMLGSGLYVYSHANGRWHAVRDGLPSSNITAIARSGGYIYVGTDNGLVRIAEQELEQ